MYILSIVLTCFGITFALFSTFQTTDTFTFNHLLSLLFWVIIPAPIALSNIIGLLAYRDPSKVKKIKDYKDFHLNVVYVTRGTNLEAIKRATYRSKQILKHTKVPHSIFVVSDEEIDVPHTVCIPVPKDFKPENGAKWKARALEYYRQEIIKLPTSVNERQIRENGYTIHLDEESWLSPDCIRSIYRNTKQYGNNWIGQGEIQYNGYNYGENIITTAVDCIRTGDDLGRFRLQYKLLKKPAFGIHGSFVVIPHSIYEKTSFDLGGKGSITEDAYFGLTASVKNIPFIWIDGTIQEQSPFTLSDLIKQRRRWFNGISLLVDDPIVPLKYKLILVVSHFCWALSFGSMLWTIVSLLLGYEQNVIVSLLSMIIFASFFSIYMVGSWRNTQPLPLKKKWLYRATNLLLFPFATFVESVAVMYAILKPIDTFEIIKK